MIPVLSCLHSVFKYESIRNSHTDTSKSNDVYYDTIGINTNDYVIPVCRKVNILHLAASAGSGAILTYLMEKYPDSDLRETDSLGNTLLHSAVTNKSNPEVLELVLNVDTNERSAREGNNNIRIVYSRLRLIGTYSFQTAC